ncbi:MAG: hypothetical protein Q7R39_04545 [Dehalococcoidia bacterium]|nr:hypothetical protein [Dehalococcoidia bacterium]
MNVLATILTWGLAAGAIAVFVKALPWPAGWKKRKPMGCAACSAGWSCILLGAVATLEGIELPSPLECAAAMGIAQWFYHHLNPPPLDFGD